MDLRSYASVTETSDFRRNSSPSSWNLVFAESQGKTDHAATWDKSLKSGLEPGTGYSAQSASTQNAIRPLALTLRFSSPFMFSKHCLRNGGGRTEQRFSSPGRTKQLSGGAGHESSNRSRLDRE